MLLIYIYTSTAYWIFPKGGNKKTSRSRPVLCFLVSHERTVFARFSAIRTSIYRKEPFITGIRRSQTSEEGDQVRYGASWLWVFTIPTRHSVRVVGFARCKYGSHDLLSNAHLKTVISAQYCTVTVCRQWQDLWDWTYLSFSRLLLVDFWLRDFTFCVGGRFFFKRERRLKSMAQQSKIDRFSISLFIYICLTSLTTPNRLITNLSSHITKYSLNFIYNNLFVKEKDL